MKLNRRSSVHRSASWSTASVAQQHREGQGIQPRIDRSRINAVSDEVSMQPEESIAFAHHFGLQ
jgi:hypothetical protein